MIKRSFTLRSIKNWHYHLLSLYIISDFFFASSKQWTQCRQADSIIRQSFLSTEPNTVCLMHLLRATFFDSMQIPNPSLSYWNLCANLILFHKKYTPKIKSNLIESIHFFTKSKSQKRSITYLKYRNWQLCNFFLYVTYSSN